MKTICQNHIVAMDETSVNFENPASTTISRKGENTVSLATTGHEKKCVTVLLTASSDRKKRIPLFLYLYRQFALEYIRVWCSQKKKSINNNLTQLITALE